MTEKPADKTLTPLARPVTVDAPPQPEGPAAEDRAAQGPTAAAERIEILDVLRGLAIFGILLVNIEYHASPTYTVFHDAGGNLPPIEQAAVRLVRFLAESKFYVLFSCLFGYGFALQLRRAEGGARSFARRYVRRTIALLGFGLLHGVFLFVGDILSDYALLGLLLLAFRRCADRTLVIWAIVLIWLPALVLAGLVGAQELASMTPGGAETIGHSTDEALAEEADWNRRSLEIYSGGSFSAIVRHRSAD